MPGLIQGACLGRHLQALGRSVSALTLLALAACSRTGLLDDDRLAPGCSDGTSKLTRAYPTVMFVLDRSTSMSNRISYDDSSTRWEALNAALSASLPSMDRAARVGALLFPESTSSEQCSVNPAVQLEPALGNAARLLQLIESRSPGGGTPTADAIRVAGEALGATRASSTARAMILATDGSPDCNSNLDPRTCRCITQSAAGICPWVTHCLDDERTIVRVSHYAARGIPTYVVGIQTEGDNEYSDVLDAIAVAGGKPQTGAGSKYFRARSQAELDEALRGVIRQVGNCVYLSQSVPNEGGSIHLHLNGAEIPAEQWSWQDQDNGELVIRDQACETLLSNPDADLTASVVCAR